MKKIKLLSAFFFIFILLSLCCFANAQTVSVGIHYGSSALNSKAVLSFENGFQLGTVSTDGDFMPIMFFSSDSVSVIAGSDNSLAVKDNNDGSILYQSSPSGTVAFSPIFGDSAIPYTAIGSYKYPGVLSFKGNGSKITVINYVDSEQYIRGVLPSEVFPSWHEEALKAAAVATRTYTYHSMGGKHKSLGFDLCNTTCCQVYSGLTKCTDSTDLAVYQTEGQILSYNNELITAVYHAISGGITESAGGAWGSDNSRYPYLTVVETPFEEYDTLSKGHWTKILTDDDINVLMKAYGFKNRTEAPIASITVDDDTPGYLNNMTITDTNGFGAFLKTSSNIRSFFSSYVLSSNFTIGNIYLPDSGNTPSASVISADGTYDLQSSEIFFLNTEGLCSTPSLKHAYYIDGKGYGHGVGMSQYGAQFAAKAGYTYSEILEIYYPGTLLEDYQGLLAKQQAEE